MRYREKGDWFDPVTEFPAVLWAGPPFGYLRFELKDDLKAYSTHGLKSDHPSGQITTERGRSIATMPGYIVIPQQPSN